MKTHPPPAALCLLLSILCLPLLSAPPPAALQTKSQPNSRKSNPPDYVIVTDMTVEGRKLPEPSSKYGKLVYYTAHFPHSTKQHDASDIPGHEKPIPHSYFKKILASALDPNGYRPADEGRPATQVLFFEWGVCDKIELPGVTANNRNGNSPTAADKTTQTDSHEKLIARAKLIAGQKFANELTQALKDNDLERFSTRDDDTEALVFVITNESYYLHVTAFDFEEHEKNRKKLLWTTTISTPAPAFGLLFKNVLPVMVGNVAYFLGRETDGPEIVRRRTSRKLAHEIDIETRTIRPISSPPSTNTPAPAPNDTSHEVTPPRQQPTNTLPRKRLPPARRASFLPV